MEDEESVHENLQDEADSSLSLFLHPSSMKRGFMPSSMLCIKNKEKQQPDDSMLFSLCVWCCC